MLSNADTPRVFGYSLAIFGLIAVLAYGLFLSTPLILGPSITLTSPKDGDQVEGVTTIRGKVSRVSTLTINGLEVALNEDGTFEVVRALPKGYTEVVVTARDRFNRSVTKRAGVITTFNTNNVSKIKVQSEGTSTASSSDEE